MPWVEAMFDVPWNLIVFQCNVCNKIRGEKKEQGLKVVDLKCAHAKK
jgi:hypothetical protein